MEFQRKINSALLLSCLLLCYPSLTCYALYTIAEWDFDSHDGMKTVPNFSSDDNFVADLSPLGHDINSILVPGRDNTTSVYVDGKSFNLATELGFTCLRDLDACESTWSAEFWLKIVDWNIGGNTVIMRTTNLNRTDPGLYIGKGSGDDILLYVRGSSGKTLWRTFSQEPFMGKWGKLFFMASDKKILILINSKYLSGRATIEDRQATSVTPANFVVGDNSGPTFYLDDVRVRYPGDRVEATSASTTGMPVTTAATTVFDTTEEKTTPSPTAASTTESTISTYPPTTTKMVGTTITIELPETTEQLNTSEEPTSIPLTTTSTTLATVVKDPLSYIWIPILIALLAVLIVAVYLLCFLCCCRRRRESRRGDPGHELAERHNNGGYARASTIEPYQDDGSQVDTDGNNTDRDEHNGRLLGSKQKE